MELTQKHWLFLLVFGLLIISGIVIRPYISALLSAAVIAYLLYPLHNRLKKKVGNMISALFFTVGLFFGIISLIAYGITFIFYRLSAIESFITSVNDFFTRFEIIDLTLIPNQLMSRANEYILSFSTQMINYFVLLFIFFVSLYYFLLNGTEVIKFLKEILPISENKKDKLLADIKKQGYTIFYVQCFLGLIQGLVGGIVLFLLGYEFVVIGGLIMAILGVIPVLGPFAFYIPLGLFSIASGDVVQGVLLIIIGLSVVSMIDNILRPVIVGRKSQVHPLTVLLGFFGGIAVFGITGLLIGPIILSITITLIKDLKELHIIK